MPHRGAMRPQKLPHVSLIGFRISGLERDRYSPAAGPGSTSSVPQPVLDEPAVPAVVTGQPAEFSGWMPPAWLS
jgi:hypothetical protein